MNREQVLYINDRIMRGSLILYVFVMTIPHTATLRAILLFTPILGLIIRGILTKRFPIPHTPLDIPILFYASIIVFKTVTSIDPGYSINILRKSLLYQMAFYYLTVSALDSPKYTRRLLTMLMITVTVIASVGLMGYLSGELVKDGRATSFFTSFGMVAFFTALVMPIALGRFLCTHGWQRSVSLGVVIVCLTFMLVTMSRGAWISSLIAVSILAALKDRRMLVLLLIGVLSAPWFLPPDILLRATSITSIEELEQSETFGDRIWMWRSAAQMIRERPWFGAGYGNRVFQRLYPDYMYSQSSGIVFENAHNLYIQKVLETGFFGLLSFLIIITGVFWLIFIQIRRKPLPIIESQLLGIAGSFTVFLIFSLTTFRYENETGILFWILVGCVVSLYQSGYPLSRGDIGGKTEYIP
jgi:putative inorganic carbon (hco3(-)) transporter